MQHGKPLVIGVAGGSGSGKSTLAKHIAGALEGYSVTTIPMDRYFLKVKPKMVAPYTGLTYEDHNHPESFDLDGLVRDLDALLAQNRPPQVVIVEGLLTLYEPSIRSRLDLKIFLDVQADERIVRRLRRNMAHGLPFDDIAAFYLDSRPPPPPGVRRAIALARRYRAQREHRLDAWRGPRHRMGAPACSVPSTRRRSVTDRATHDPSGALYRRPGASPDQRPRAPF